MRHAGLRPVRPTDRDVTVVARSHDHGQTFTKAIVDTNYDFPFNEPLGTATLTGENFRINSYPQLAYDGTQPAGLTWNDDRNGLYDPKTGESIRTNGDNILSSSSDGRRGPGHSVLGTPQDEVFGAVAIRDGAVAVTSYTRHYAGNRSVDLDYAYWSSTKAAGQARFDLRRVTTQSANPQVQFVGHRRRRQRLAGRVHRRLLGARARQRRAAAPVLDRLPGQARQTTRTRTRTPRRLRID